MSIIDAFEEAKKQLLGNPGIHGISYTSDRIIVYAKPGTLVPYSIKGYPVEVIYTSKFEVL